MTTDSKKTSSPPYIAFSTFLNFIKQLQASGVPSRIDKSLLRNMSGSNQSSLLATLKWFDLINELGEHGQPLDDLVSAGDNIGGVLRKLLPTAYHFMNDGINLERATGAQVEEKFREYGVNGATVVKAMAFFISACKTSGIALSPHIKPPKVHRSKASVKAKKTDHNPTENHNITSSDEIEKAAVPTKSPTSSLMDKFPSFDPAWPENIQSQWFAAFSKLQDMVKEK